MDNRALIRNLLMERKGLLLLEGFKKADFDRICANIREAIKKGYPGWPEKEINDVYSEYLFRLISMDPTVFTQGFSVDAAYSMLAKAKYSFWLFNRANEMAKAYLKDESLYASIMKENLDLFPMFNQVNSGGYIDAVGILNKVSFDIGKFKNFKQVSQQIFSETVTSDMQKYVPLPDMDISQLKKAFEHDDDAVFMLSSEDIMKHVSDKLQEKDSIIQSLGEDTWNSYEQWLLTPKFFAVGVASYDGAERNGEYTRWCTRFGAGGDHTADYLDYQPLFVLYCNEDFNPAAGVAEGAAQDNVKYPIKRMFQFHWKEYNDYGSLSEFKDVENVTVNSSKMSAMGLDAFCKALFDVSSDFREGYNPPFNDSY